MDNLDADAKRRFERWLENLGRSIESLPEASTEGYEVSRDLATQLQTSVELEDEAYRARLQGRGGKIRKLASGPNESRLLLRHISLPHALRAYSEVKAELVSGLSSSSSSSSVGVSATASTSVDPPDSQAKYSMVMSLDGSQSEIESYFRSLSSSSSSSFSGQHNPSLSEF
jgi:hypothetical protein